MRKIPFIDLSRQQERIRANLDKRLGKVLNDGDYILGKEIDDVEEKLRAFTGARYCVTCSSGSAGLLMAVMVLDLPPATPVFIPAFSFFASAEMPVLAGLVPEFVDIESNFFQISAPALEKAVQKSDAETGLILPVDLFGHPADYDEILAIAKKRGFYTLEDAAQAFGAKYGGKNVCNLGCDLAVTSFFPAKPLGCYGDGGAIFTNDSSLAEKLYSIRVHGQGSTKYDNVRLGINGRFDTIQAAVLLAKLDIFEDEIKRRDLIARAYNEALKNIHDLRLPSVAPNRTDVWAQYCVLVPRDKRHSIREKLAKKGIPTNIYYPIPLPYLKAFEYLRLPGGAFPEASYVSERILALPFHPYLENDEIAYISDALSEALK